MASGNSLPNFEEIMKRGSATEPKNHRPIPRIKNSSQDTQLSLNSAVKAAKESKKKQGVPTASASSEPPKRKNRHKKTISNDESGFSSDGKLNQSRRRTPMTMPRTKITSATPLEQKIALKRLKQRLDFGDKKVNQKEVDSEHVREQYKHYNGGMSVDDAVSITSSNVTSDNQASEISDVDTNKINERLNQVKEYIKQATGMYLSLSMAGNSEPKQSEQMTKLAKLIQQLRIQEQGYTDLLKKTLQEETNSNCDKQSVTSTEQSLAPVETCQNGADMARQHQELERLKEQQALLKKIVEQQKELQALKERQSTLLQMQENAETLITENRNLHKSEMEQKTTSESQEAQDRDISSLSEDSHQTSTNVSDFEDTEKLDRDTLERRMQLENKLKTLHDKKHQMDELMETLKNLKNSQQGETNMRSILNDDDLSEVASEVLAAADEVDDEASDIEQKIDRLNDVRERLQELRSIVTDYESGSNNLPPTTTDVSRDNRLHAQSIKQKQGNTLTGAGGARLRVPANANNQDVILKDLQALQASIEELMDNRNRPVPQGIQRKNIDVTRNAAFKNKNTNQEKKQLLNPPDLEALFKDLPVPDEYAEKLRELNHARQQFTSGNIKKEVTSAKLNNTDLSGTENIDTSEKESDLESNTSSTLQWQDDPEFQTKVKKLQMAKEKLHHLQELVKVVQHGGGPHLPIDDLEDLTLTLSDNEVESEYGESEEEAFDEANEDSDDEEDEEEDEEDDDEEDDEDDEDEDQTADEQSEVSKSTTDANFNFAAENGLSDNERRYQGLLRKQRLELNYLLKERERLLEAQRKLSDLAGQSTVEERGVANYAAQKKSGSNSSSKQKTFPTLTKAELRKQEKFKQDRKENTMRRLFPKMESNEFYGSEHEFYPPISDAIEQSDFKVPMTAMSNPMAVTEIRRQRDLFEQRKKQKFVEKQRRKKQNQNDENQSDDRATYVINSDIDEGVGVSMYSADVTTAATWGGSTEQSSDEEDSAVGDEFPVREAIANDEDEYGSHFDQPEEEEEEADGGNNVPPLFKVKKFEEQPRRTIRWNQNDNMQEKKNRGVGSVSWSLDVSPPRSRKRPKQGNLTPAHKLIQDNKRKRQNKPSPKETLPIELKPTEEVQSQLATICSSLLRNEQTLLQMLQNQMSRSTESTSVPFLSGNAQNVNATVLADIQDFFISSNHNESYSQTLSALRTAYERIEQHQLDMEFLRQQFEKLNQPTESITNPGATAFQSPWPNPPSLHFSSIGPVTAANAPQMSENSLGTTQPLDYDKPLFQKETQTETTLFQDPFRPPMQQYTLFGESKDEGTGETQPRNFDFSPVMEPTSPGVVGDRSFSQQHDDLVDEDANEDEIMFPYRLRVSEYNPLSYQGNFANTMTGNVVTVSKMSMSKKKAETNASETGDKSIWPSFFKLADNVDEKAENEGSEKSSKFTSSVAGQSASNEPQARETKGDSKTNVTGSPGDPNDNSNVSLFEALRDSIYSEVATLIAMNESRPHYLIELFRELQLLNSDYLRQRALYSLQELVTRYLTDENVSPSTKAAFTKETIPTSGISYEQWIASTSEQTPSESVMTTTDDEGESQALETLARQIQNNEMYDYAELADSQSEGNLSTPSSQHDAPFAAEDLGNTVINLEDALQKMRTYEHNMAEAKRAFEQISSNVRESTPSNVDSQQAAYETIKRRLNANLDSVSNSSAGDMNSETSSDMPQPSVDTQKLDRQIKAVMMDLIPFLNENIELTCTEEFLDKIRNLIVEFAKQKEPGSEEEQFGRFFHSQLDSILKDSLMKFNSRKLKECGEDILIDVSEILFNELAFFKLMQDLDRPLYGAASAEYSSQHHVSDHSKMPFVNHSTMYDDSSAAESTDVPENEENEETEAVPKNNNSNSSVSTSSSNAFVMVDAITDDETESARQFVKVELSVSETRPVRSSGSGEEDNEEEPSSFSTVSAPASSIHTYSQAVQANVTNEQDGAGASNSFVNVQEPVEEQDNDQSMVVEDDRDEGDRDAQEDERSEHERGGAVAAVNNDEEEDGNPENERAEDQRDIDEVAEPESNMALGESDQRQNNDQAESSQQQNDTEEGEEDDLPEADMVSDDNIAIAQAVLAHLEGQQELAGDPSALPPANNGN